MIRPLPSSAEVQETRIVVRAGLADLLSFRGIPGAAWDTRRKAWTYPATPRHARLLRSSLKTLTTTEEFNKLLVMEVSSPAPVQPAAAVPVPPPALLDPALAIPGLRTQPWRHQVAAYEFCLDRFSNGLSGVLLALGMGCGKTLVALMLLLALKSQRVMIDSPLRVVHVWVSEIERHVGVPVVVVALDDQVGSVARKQELAAEKLRLAEARGIPFICIINYDSVWREPFATWAEKQTWDLVIADECHRLKAPGGKASL